MKLECKKWDKKWKKKRDYNMKKSKDIKENLKKNEIDLKKKNNRENFRLSIRNIWDKKKIKKFNSNYPKKLIKKMKCMNRRKMNNYFNNNKEMNS